MNTSNIDDLLENLIIHTANEYGGFEGFDDEDSRDGFNVAKQAIQQELLKARIDEISILRNGYGWGDALETSEYILDDRLDDLQAKLKGDDK